MRLESRPETDYSPIRDDTLKSNSSFNDSTMKIRGLENRLKLDLQNHLHRHTEGSYKDENSIDSVIAYYNKYKEGAAGGHKNTTISARGSLQCSGFHKLDDSDKINLSNIKPDNRRMIEALKGIYANKAHH